MNAECESSGPIRAGDKSLLRKLSWAVWLLAVVGWLGCGKLELSSTLPKSPETDSGMRKWREDTTNAVQLEARADLIVETVGYPGNELITILRPEGMMPASNKRIGLPHLEGKIAAMPKTNSLAVIEVPAYGFAMSNVAHIVTALKRNGFTSVEIVVTGWGNKFLAPKQDR
jgi:hypothetical protein